MPSSTAARSCATRWSRATRGMPGHSEHGGLIAHKLFGELLELRAADFVVGGLEQRAQCGDLAQIRTDANLQGQRLAVRERSHLQRRQAVFAERNGKPGSRGCDQADNGHAETEPGIPVAPPAWKQVSAPTNRVPKTAHCPDCSALVRGSLLRPPWAGEAAPIDGNSLCNTAHSDVARGLRGVPAASEDGRREGPRSRLTPVPPPEGYGRGSGPPPSRRP